MKVEQLVNAMRVVTPVRHAGVDPVLHLSADVTLTTPWRRVWDRQQFVLPLRINGRSARGILDTGIDATLIDLAAARALGLPFGSAAMPAAVAYGETTFVVEKDLDIRLANRRLPSGHVAVNNSSLKSERF